MCTYSLHSILLTCVKTFKIHLKQEYPLPSSCAKTSFTEILRRYSETAQTCSHLRRWKVASACDALLLKLIPSAGLIETAFEVQDPSCDFSVMVWIDFIVDTFFVADIFGRAFVFGQIIEIPGHFSDSHMVVRQPDQVLLRYVRKGMVIDVITGVPFSWIIMFGGLNCAGTGDGNDIGSLRLIRLIRGTRVTRVLKLFNQPEVRKAIRRLKQRTGHSTLLGIIALLVWTLLLNHVSNTL